MGMLSWWRFCAIAFGFIAWACSSPPVTPPVQSAYRDSQPASSPALEYLPRQTQVVVAARSPQDLAARLGWKQLAARHREPYERAVARVTQLVGHNLIDPDNWLQVGLDPRRALGLAWLGDDTGVVFASIRDHDKFQTWVYRNASKLGTRLIPRVAGTSLIIAPEGSARWQLVIRGQIALLVASDGSEDRARAAAQRIAQIGIDRSLAGLPDFAAAMSDLRFGRDLAGYWSLDTTLGPVVDGLGVQGQLALAIGAEIEERAVRVKAFVPMAQGASLRRVLRARDHRSRLIEVLGAHPLFVLAADVDATQVATIPLGRAMNAMLEPLGRDFVRDVAPLLSGEVGLAVVHGGEPNADDGTSLDLHVIAGLAEPDRATEVLADTIKGSALPVRFRKGQDGQYAVVNLGWPGASRSHSAYLGVRGAYAYASTVRDFGARLGAADSQAGAVAKTSAAAFEPEVAELLAAPRGAVRVGLNMTAFGYLWLHRQGANNPAASPDAANPRPAAADQAVPLSAEYRRKERELEAMRARARQAAAERVQRKNRRMLEVARAFGWSAFRVELDHSGLVIYGGQFLGLGGLAGLLDILVDHFMGARGSEVDVSSAERKVDELERELDAIRERDIANHKEAQAR